MFLFQFIFSRRRRRDGGTCAGDVRSIFAIVARALPTLLQQHLPTLNDDDAKLSDLVDRFDGFFIFRRKCFIVFH